MGCRRLNETHPAAKPMRGPLFLLSLLSLILILILPAAASPASLLRLRTPSHPNLPRKPTRAISKACARSRLPALCVDSLLDFPGSLSANEQDLVHISFNLTLHHLNQALYSSSHLSSLHMDLPLRSAYDACLELLDDSVHALTRSFHSLAPPSSDSRPTPLASSDDVITWLSAALTNQDTCTDGFSQLSGNVKDQMTDKLHNLSELVSNCLALFSGSVRNDFSGVPIQNKRRLMNAAEKEYDSGNFPGWMSRRERRLLTLPVGALQADIVVSKDGNGTVKTIAEAIKKAPEFSTRKTIIYVMAGRYEEKNLKVGRKKTNLMFVGDGKGKTVISGGKSIFDNVTTFHTASFAVSGAGIILRDVTFVNWAGPARHQAVALRVSADHAVVYRCNVIGYQDTLYVHSNRQFFRECDIYGTVDFIFGNAAVVFQNCSIYARKAMELQKNTITAQNRKDPNQNTGISIHASRILATPDLASPSTTTNPTYLGRPWKLYSRVVYMQSYIGGHVHPRGWLEWNATFALDTLYYGEYMNYGPGGAVGQRVTWPGYRVITSRVEASQFTVAQFIYGSSWLPSTGVAFLGGLNL
ncbi:probable pectinesterase/pectinesterase inhibitor 34 [Cucurbita maxima]|uniref:Pectinesterase n=1 Tax=Cucurbita maxima TaxID=3661 RepID=A0A6J1HX67_CUCMA|nr:probable pectinesterase/pectinesterase inhibitor 34 [Cucurbita maxima]